MKKHVIVSENSIRLLEVYHLIRYIEGRIANYGRRPEYEPLLSHLRQRRDKLKGKI